MTVDSLQLLPPGLVERFYRASGRLSAFRRADGGEYDSEEWLGSTTEVFGGTPGEGLTVLGSGDLLSEVVSHDPLQMLGPEHVARFGPSTELLVKILDAGQRLPVHAHPDRGFAAAHLGGVHGKAEAWYVLEAGDDAVVHLGFRRPVERAELERWMAEQRSEDMLDAMHAITVAPGDSVFVPAGYPHAIGAGILLVEVQEPTDYSMLLEWDGYAIDAAQTGRLGLELDRALDAVNTAGIARDRIEELVVRADRPRAGGTALLSEQADAYFRVERVTAGAVLDAGYSVVVVVDGTIRLGGGDVQELTAGDVVLVPYAAGTLEVTGDGTAVRCRPPAPGQSTVLRVDTRESEDR